MYVQASRSDTAFPTDSTWYIQNIRHFDFGTDFITGYIRWAGTSSLIYPVIKSVPKTKCLIFCLSVIY